MKKDHSVTTGLLPASFLASLLLLGCNGKAPAPGDGENDGADADGGEDTDVGVDDVRVDEGGDPADDGESPDDGVDDVQVDDGGDQADCEDPPEDTFGAEPNPTCNPIGGGAGYRPILSTGDHVATTEEELISALASAGSGQVVFIPGNVTIDLTDDAPIFIPGGVTLASDRGKDGSSGALIVKTHRAGDSWCEPTLQTDGDNVRVTGLQMEGEMYPSTDTVIPPDESYYLVGILQRDHTGLEVDNCELRGFAWASAFTWNEDNPSGSAHFHHNFIHASLARSEGYGVEVAGGHALVEANLFDENRHSIAAATVAGESYEARYNIVLGHGEGIGFAHFDVHDGVSEKTYRMHHNTFNMTPVWNIGLQGSGPRQVYIDHNILNYEYGCDEAIFQHGTGNLYVTDNICGGEYYPGEEGIVWYL
jgi:hypothetical protein